MVLMFFADRGGGEFIALAHMQHVVAAARLGPILGASDVKVVPG